MSAQPLPAPSTGLHDPSFAANYQQRLAPVLFEPLAEILLRVVAVRPGDHVLDVACGTGVVARAAALRAGRRGRVAAVDVNETMLAEAARRAPHEGAASIAYAEAFAEELPFPDDTFDVVLCQQGIQHFADPPRAVGEMRRVLRDRGAAGVMMWSSDHRHELFADYGEALVAAGVDGSPPAWTGGRAARVPRAMRPDDMPALLVDAGFSRVVSSVVEHTVAFPSTESALLAMRGTRYGAVFAALPPARRRAAEAELRRRFACWPGEAIRRSTTSVIARGVA